MKKISNYKKQMTDNIQISKSKFQTRRAEGLSNDIFYNCSKIFKLQKAISKLNSYNWKFIFKIKISMNQTSF
jgi:hypothetical protein